MTDVIDLEPFDRYCHEIQMKYRIFDEHLSCYMCWFGAENKCNKCRYYSACEQMYAEGVDCDGRNDE